MRSVIQTALLAMLTSQASAWWGNGHMMVARIAHDVLAKSNPDVLARAEAILSSDINQYTRLEKDHHFVECATFADAIKKVGWGATSHWHFQDTPYFDNYTKPDWYPNAYNVTWALASMHQDLKYAVAPKPVEDASKPQPDVAYGLADGFNMRMFIHFVGDIHQPLHATSRYTAEYPEGDRGGNSFKIGAKDGVKELHALWDSVIYKYGSDIAQPLNTTSWEWFGEQAADIMKQFPQSSFNNINEMDYEVWAQESFELSKSVVYKGIKEGEVPSDEYVKKALPVAVRQVALAGYRLAYQLTNLWTKKPKTFLQ